MSWIFVKLTLILNYMGQTAWLISHKGEQLDGRNPFYSIMPEWFLPVGIGIATVATVVASQALISGSFTLINEAMRLNFWPKVRIKYPTVLKGQLYISSINWMLYLGCVSIVFLFRESSRMEAAYGLTIILGMIMSSRLLSFFMIVKKYPKWFVTVFSICYIVIEGTFLVALLEKFIRGGYVTDSNGARICDGMLVPCQTDPKALRGFCEPRQLPANACGPELRSDHSEIRHPPGLYDKRQ
jgi:KUP system potassium uptake protein